MKMEQQKQRPESQNLKTANSGALLFMAVPLPFDGFLRFSKVFSGFFWTFLPIAVLDFLLRVAKSRSDRSFRVKLCFFKTAKISRAADVLFARAWVSKAICFAV
jgi:hypothetical protein